MVNKLFLRFQEWVLRFQLKREPIQKALQSSLEELQLVHSEVQHLRKVLVETQNRKLTLKDLELNGFDQTELQSLSAHSRMALYKLVEIVRLCEGFGTEGRSVAQLIRDRILVATKASHNALPHEESGAIKTILKKSETSKLLPRFDNAI